MKEKKNNWGRKALRGNRLYRMKKNQKKKYIQKDVPTMKQEQETGKKAFKKQKDLLKNMIAYLNNLTEILEYEVELSQKIKQEWKYCRKKG